MKVLHFWFVLWLGCAVAVNAQTGSGGVDMTTGVDARHAKLQLKTDLIKILPCSDGSLRFSLRLSFANQGEGAVILDRRSAVISKYMVSRTLEDATEKKYEIEVPRLVGLEAAGMTLDSAPDESQFIILKPREVYSLDRTFNFQILGDADSRSFRVGQNVLQIVVLTWYYPRASNVEWRDRWRAKGYLWSDPLTSTGMPFTVEMKPTLVNCR